MNELISTVDWSRAQFALTAMYHWLFVPLTIGLALIVAVMETIYVRTGNVAWRGITKFWMTLFGINFAVGVATGLILEFEFGTNWSNYSWFVGDIFGAPLAIEGLFAFFLEATFVAVMFFGWNKVSRGFHLMATWLTAVGVTLSALWILVANSWMQLPVGMEFDPAQMRNVMTHFWEMVFSEVAVAKFWHTVFSAWALGGVFVVGVAGWMLARKRNVEAMLRSVKVGAWIGLIGLFMTFLAGHESARVVSKVQPMKLAAMEGLYDGHRGQSIIVCGIYNPEVENNPQADPMLFDISITGGLSFLATGHFDAFVPGINDIIAGRSETIDGKPINTVSYNERIAKGKLAKQALIDYDNAKKAGNTIAMTDAQKRVEANYQYFGYGFLDNPKQAIPPVWMTFYSFHAMVLIGFALFAFLLIVLFVVYRYPQAAQRGWMCWFGLLSIAGVWICSECGWVTSEVGRQPWVIQDVMPTGVAVSDISSGSVQFTFWIFFGLFAVLLAAEISIMLRQIAKRSHTDIQVG